MDFTKELMVKLSENRILAIIPARGGSKKIPRKNIRLLAGKPLIAWTIELALKSKCISRVLVSTEDAEIADISKKYDAEVPFLRPTELANDEISDLPVCQHALTWLAEHETYHPETIVWLRPTCPLRRIQDIDSAVNKLNTSGADCVRSVSIVKEHPYWMKLLEQDRLKPLIEGKDETTYYQRQLLPPVYHLNGVVDVVRAENVIEQGRLFAGDMRAYVMPPEFSLDIDTERDFMLAEVIIKRQEND